MMPADAEPASIVQEGGKLVCPGCEQEGDAFYNFRQLDLPDKYRRELNPVYVHLKHRDGCGHVFSPGDPWIIEAYLAGDLVPRESLEQANDRVRQLEDELRRKDQKVNLDDTERRVAAA